MKILKNKLILIKEEEIDYSNKIKNSQDIYKFITEIIKPSQEPEEVLYVVVLTNSNHIQAFYEGVALCYKYLFFHLNLDKKYNIFDYYYKIHIVHSNYCILLYL